MRQYLLILLILLASTLEAQYWKAGVFMAGGLSRMTLNENQLNDEIFVRQGSVFPTASFGIQSVVTKSKDQPSLWLTLEKAVLFEFSLCRCGGNIEIISTLPDGSKTLDELQYVQYQGNFSAKAYLGLGSIKFFAGPNISSNFYSGVNIVKDDEHRSAKDQLNPIVLGYEIGSGIEFGKFLFAARYRGYFTPYGRETSLIPTVYGNAQFLFSLSYFYLDKNTEKNRGSIFGL